MKLVQAFLSFAAVFTLGFALTACEEEKTEKTAATNEPAFKYGSVEIPVSDGTLCIAPFFVAKEKGFFAKEGVDVKFVSANAETRKIGLNNGTYPITNSDFAFFQSVENGVNIKVVEGFHIGCIHLLVKKGSPIRNAQGLKGKKIAVNAIGATPHQAATLWLEANGVSAINDVQFLPYADGNLALEALERGQVEAVSLWDPLGSLAAVRASFWKRNRKRSRLSFALSNRLTPGSANTRKKPWNSCRQASTPPSKTRNSQLHSSSLTNTSPLNKRQRVAAT